MRGDIDSPNTLQILLIEVEIHIIVGMSLIDVQIRNVFKGSSTIASLAAHVLIIITSSIENSHFRELALA